VQNGPSVKPERGRLDARAEQRERNERPRPTGRRRRRRSIAL